MTLFAGVLSSATLVASLASADTAPVTCAQLDGTVVSTASGLERTYAVASLEDGDQVSISAVFGGLPTSYEITVGNGTTKFRAPVPYAFTVGSTAELSAGNYFFDSLRPAEDTRMDAATAVNFMTVFAEVTISCSSGGGSETLAGGGALGQSGSILSGLRQLRNTPDGGSVQASRGIGLFGVSGDQATGWRVWGFTEFRDYSNAGEGSGFTLTAGMDHDFGQMRAGVVLAFDRTRLDLGAGAEEMRSLAIGPYVSGDAGAIQYDAFVTVSRPEYDLLSGAETGQRVSYGLSGEGNFDMPMGQVIPYLSVLGAVEDVADETLKSRQVSAGVRMEFNTDSDLTPYLSLGYSATNFESALTGTTENRAPQWGVGFSGPAGDGTVALDLSGGELAEDLRVMSIRLSYQMEF